MKFIISFGVGFVISLIIGIPFIYWSIKKGKIVYADSRIRAKIGKLFSENELKNILDSNMLPKLQKTRYWHILQFSENRTEFEKTIENLLDKEYNTIHSFSSDTIKPFLDIYFKLKQKIKELKLILNCVENNRNKKFLAGIIKNKSLVGLLKFDYVEDIINHLKKNKEFDFLDPVIYSKFGVLGLETSLDNHYFKCLYKSVKNNKNLYSLYKIIRTNYLIRTSLRLKNYNFSESEIIDLLNLKNKKEINFLKKDKNVLIKELSEKNNELRQNIISGKNQTEALQDYFNKSVINRTKKLRLKKPYSIISSFYVLVKTIEEINYMKRIWVLK
ncbi:hypothetical protein GF327_07155 [Candidatus Woesearchaeota archaeon]|nr:hypothetical protein [Candidatus Woesearchaeota archaeon]